MMITVAQGLTTAANAAGWSIAIGTGAIGLGKLAQGTWHMVSQAVVILWEKIKSFITHTKYDPNSTVNQERYALMKHGANQFVEGLKYIAACELLKVGAQLLLGAPPLSISKVMDVLGWRVVTRGWV